MNLRNVVLALLILVLVLAFGSLGCRRDEERLLESPPPEMALPSLTEGERVVKDAIRDIVIQRRIHWPSNSALNVNEETTAILKRYPDVTDRKKIFLWVRQDILEMPIPRGTNGVPDDAVWMRSVGCYLDCAYSALVLRNLRPGTHVEFEDLVFDLQIARRLEKERPIIEGWLFNDPLVEWVRGAFYCEGSDFYVYWLRASPEERKRVMKWFVNHGGRVPDWAH